MEVFAVGVIGSFQIANFKMIKYSIKKLNTKNFRFVQ